MAHFKIVATSISPKIAKIQTQYSASIKGIINAQTQDEVAIQFRNAYNASKAGNALASASDKVSKVDIINHILDDIRKEMNWAVSDLVPFKPSTPLLKLGSYKPSTILSKLSYVIFNAKQTIGKRSPAPVPQPQNFKAVTSERRRDLPQVETVDRNPTGQQLKRAPMIIATGSGGEGLRREDPPTGGYVGAGEDSTPIELPLAHSASTAAVDRLRRQTSFANSSDARGGFSKVLIELLPTAAIA